MSFPILSFSGDSPHSVTPVLSRFHLHLAEMTRGSKISDDICSVIIRMASSLPREDISFYTGVSLRSIARILKDFRDNGATKVTSTKEKGRKRHLRDLDVEVRFLCLVL